MPHRPIHLPTLRGSRTTSPALRKHREVYDEMEVVYRDWRGEGGVTYLEGRVLVPVALLALCQASTRSMTTSLKRSARRLRMPCSGSETRGSTQRTQHACKSLKIRRRGLEA